MTAIHSPYPALTLKAGKRALARMRQHGLDAADVGVAPQRGQRVAPRSPRD